jgi:curved DNA-binding protein
MPIFGFQCAWQTSTINGLLLEKDRLERQGKNWLVAMKTFDYYEFLQISPNADRDTIHRVYRFLGARYHPDNPVSGNAETFTKLKTAYEVLSNPARRAEFDASCKNAAPRVAAPLSASIDFMDDLEGEKNRRLGLLAVLYARRRMNAVAPEVTLAEIEVRMGFPRDYLDFTVWYLQRKGYVNRADNGDLALTVDGVDFVETERVNIPMLNKLLTNGADHAVAGADHAVAGADHAVPDSKSANGEFSPAIIPDIAISDVAPPVERRINTRDRRQGLPDRRVNPVERRSGAPDRRFNPAERRLGSPDRRSGDDRRLKG